MTTQNNEQEHNQVNLDRRNALKGVAALAIVGGLAASTKPALASGNNNKLEGAWLETIAGSGNQLLYTYGEGGVLNASAASDQILGRRYSPSYGAWEKEGGRTYRYHLVAFNLNNDGELQGIFRARSTITVSQDGNSYTGEGSYQLESLANPPVITFGPNPFSQSAVRISA